MLKFDHGKANACRCRTDDWHSINVVVEKMKMKEVVAHYGSKAAVAKRLGISRVSVTQWGEEVPILRQVQIERDTQGKLTTDPERMALPRTSD
ncbi:MAG TPA: Cro/CI family transcriptional regulator [Pseudomonas sp.]